MVASKNLQQSSIPANFKNLKVFHYFDWSLVISLLSQLDQGYIHEFLRSTSEDKSSSEQQEGPILSGSSESRHLSQSFQELQRAATHHHAFERLSAALGENIVKCDLYDTSRSEVKEGDIVKISSKLAITDFEMFTRASKKISDLVKIMRGLVFDSEKTSKDSKIDMPNDLQDRIKGIGQYFEFFDRSESLYALLYPDASMEHVCVRCPLARESIEGGLKYFLQLFGAVPKVNFEVLGIITNKNSEIEPEMALEKSMLNGIDGMLMQLSKMGESTLKAGSSVSRYEMTMQPIAIYRSLGA